MKKWSQVELLRKNFWVLPIGVEPMIFQVPVGWFFLKSLTWEHFFTYLLYPSGHSTAQISLCYDVCIMLQPGRCWKLIWYWWYLGNSWFWRIRVWQKRTINIIYLTVRLTSIYRQMWPSTHYFQCNKLMFIPSKSSPHLQCSFTHSTVLPLPYTSPIQSTVLLCHSIFCLPWFRNVTAYLVS